MITRRIFLAATIGSTFIAMRPVSATSNLVDPLSHSHVVMFGGATVVLRPIERVTESGHRSGRVNLS